MAEQIYVRDPKIEDIDIIAQIESESFSMPWKHEDFLKAYNEKQLIKVVSVGDTVVGYFLALVVCDEAQIATIAVKKEFRKKGCAKKVLESAILEAWVRGLNVMYLEVRQSNSDAIALYENMGFEFMGIRKNFYENPREDAITMKFDVKGIWRRKNENTGN